MNTSAARLAGQSKKMLYGLSPWLLVGVSAVLGLAILVLSIRNSESERQHITQNFLDRGEALIWALEAGTRTGMGREGQRFLLQPLIEETARQPGVAYIAVIDRKGRVLAHSSPEQIGKVLAPESMPPLPPDAVRDSRIPERSKDGLFEVYRGFAPLSGGFPEAHDGHGHGPDIGHGMVEDGSPMRQAAAESFAFVGFDQKPFAEAIAADFWNNLVTASIVAALGFGGFISLFWAHSYRRSRRKLKDTQAVASEVVTSLPLGLVTSDPEGKLGMINSTAMTMLHISGDNLAEVQVSDIAGLDWSAVIVSLAGKEKVIDREMELAVPGTAKIPVNVSASEIRDVDGLFLGHLFILRDVSEMKRLQMEVQRNERLTVLGNLAAGVAHEIRNPLSSIKGLATYIAKKMQPDAPEEEAAKTMIMEVNRLNRVVSELLEFARPSVVKLSVADIGEVVLRALRLAEADLMSKNIQVTFASEENFPKVFINPERLTQALLNLFLNAVQAMAPDGELLLTVERRPDDEFAIIVSDNGKGMDKETLSSIFTPYFTTKSSGTGLGLAIVHQIVEGHGGKITAASTPGEGSTFTMLLPLHNSR